MSLRSALRTLLRKRKVAVFWGQYAVILFFVEA